MKLIKIKTVFIKELRDTIRDRSTIFTVILLPLVIYPLMFLGMGLLLGRQSLKEEGKISQIAVQNNAAPPRLIELIEADKKLKITNNTNPQSALNGGKIQAVINISEDSESSGNARTKLSVLYDASSRNSKVAMDRLRGLFEKYRHQLIIDRLIQSRMDTIIINPFQTDFQNIASSQKMGGFLMGTIIPYMIVMLICIGAVYPAMDITAGEKERKTIETLLVSNISRNEIVTGKMLTVITLGLVTAVLGLMSLALTILSGLSVFSVNKIQTSLSISPGAVAFSLLTLIPTAIVIVSVMLMIGSYARTVKEGSAYGSYFMMAVIMLAMGSMVPMEASSNLFAIPILNTALCQKELLMGVFNWQHIMLAVLTSSFLACISVGITVAIFKQESVLFRS